MALKQDVDKHEVLVADKENELKKEEAQQARLRDESIHLKKDLATRQVSLDDLKSRLEQLQRANANTAENTKEQRDRKNRLRVKLKTHEKELVKVEQSNMTEAQKQEKLESMKKDITNTLNILLHS
jgi:predicted nuclease with TOPRIM domain